MSGDVQPRKRKDKKRKKDDGSTEHTSSQFQSPSSGIQNEDVNIHVHKEDGTGGGICAKIVFFFLFSALAVLIGLIITEHRGLTDLDTVDQESRFSHLFEGWIDNSLSRDEENHHIEDILMNHENESHEKDEEEQEEEEEEDDEDKVDEEEEEEVRDEEAESEDEEEDEEEEEEIASEEQIQSEEKSNEDNEDEVLDSEEREDNDDESELKDIDDEEVSEEPTSEEQNISNNVENGDDEDDDGDDDDDDGDDDDDDDEDNYDEDNNDDNENLISKEDLDEESVIDKKKGEHFDKTTNEETVDDEEEVNDETIDNNETTDNDEQILVEQKEEENDSNENSRMVVKIGVGVALLVVAHVVLVRKWKSASPRENTSNKEGVIPDLSRRNTIVVPPTYQEIEQDIEDNKEEYSDEDGEVESDDDKNETKSTKLQYQELRTTYSRSLTPESEPEYQDKQGTYYEEYEQVDDEDESETGEYEKDNSDDDGDDDDDNEDDDDEDDDDDDDEVDDDDDDELLKRLEAKYGKLRNDNQEAVKNQEVDEHFSSWKRMNIQRNNHPERSDSDKQSDSDAETYEYENITNKDDFKIRDKIDEAQKNIRNNAAYAIKLFDILLQNYPSSPRSLYGKAQALDVLADRRRSNEILKKAIEVYLQLLDLEDVPDALFEAAADRCINRLRFMGFYNRAINVHSKLIARFPDEPKYPNQLVVSYLTMNRVNKARTLLENILSKYPNDGFALVHYGFILKTIDNKLNESIFYFRKGLATEEPGVIDGRFYFHLGDALVRVGKREEAMEVYEEGVRHKLFLSKYQRSLYNVEHLKGKPWWNKQETPYVELYDALEKNWKRIRDEGLLVLNEKGYFTNEMENLKESGDWKQFELFARGRKNIENCKKCPFTCKLIESIPDARGCTRGQTKFSVMHPGTHVWPHCGPTNCRLRVHLGLQIPMHTYIRVAEEIRSWENGKVFIFDDSFEHEVWHNGTTYRLVLIVDVWHPELTLVEKRTLLPI